MISNSKCYSLHHVKPQNIRVKDSLTAIPVINFLIYELQQKLLGIIYWQNR